MSGGVVRQDLHDLQDYDFNSPRSVWNRCFNEAPALPVIHKRRKPQEKQELGIVGEL